ncbi:hypothetical protein N9045_00580 [bacterium]|nr:hypothetical protein [bacterium]
MAVPHDAHIGMIIKLINEDNGMQPEPTYSDDVAANYTPEDYALAKKLIAQVGGAAEARELIDNLDQALEVLNMADYNDEDQINDIAGYTPDSVDYPVERQ